MNWATSNYRNPPGWTTTRKRIMQQHDGICHICGREGADQVDHIIEQAHGGNDEDDNLAPIHRVPCHQTKTRRAAQAARPTTPTTPSNKRKPEQHPGMTAR